jgi:hypothetical protein
VKVTADTITDEQIRAIQYQLGDNLAELIAIALSELAAECPRCGVAPDVRCTSMGCGGYRATKTSHKERLDRKQAARARCAEIWNARHAGSTTVQP